MESSTEKPWLSFFRRAPKLAVSPEAAGVVVPVSVSADTDTNTDTKERAPDADAWLVRRAQTLHGKLALLACFYVLLRVHGQAATTLTAILTAITFLPAHRRLLVALGTLAATLKLVPDEALVNVARAQGLLPIVSSRFFYPLTLVAALALCVAYAKLVFAHPKSALARRPITMLLLVYAGLVALASMSRASATLSLLLWGLASALVHYLWFLAYSLKDKAAKESDRELVLQAGAFAPFFSPSLTPFPKGASYLKKIEAKTPEALARCQLKAVRLAVWALVLYVLSESWNAFIHGAPALQTGASSWASSWLSSWTSHLPSLRFARYDAALAASASGTPLPVHESWAALLSEFIGKLLRISVYGHVIVATIRMAGFSALRNTVSPLASRSLADFWNRVYYYFKELLVELFFYPTFFRYFQKHPRLRLFFATFAAAGFGNFVYHYFSHLPDIARRGMLAQLVAMQSYAFYVVVLSIAIFVSQLREQTAKTRAPAAKAPAAPSHLARARSLGFIFGFYALLTVFDSADAHSLATCFGFALHLFGV